MAGRAGVVGRRRWENLPRFGGQLGSCFFGGPERKATPPQGPTEMRSALRLRIRMLGGFAALELRRAQIAEGLSLGHTATVQEVRPGWDVK